MPAPTAADLFKARAHPLRSRILDLLNERVASPVELAADLDQPLANVAYHARRLLELNCVRLVREQQKRGAMEHFYTSVVGDQRVIPNLVLDLHAEYVGGLSISDLAVRSGLEPPRVVELFERNGLGLRPGDG